MNEKRVNTFDIAKGIGIILVVVGHTNTHFGIEKVIYQFHMPLFFILSGFFFKDKYCAEPLQFLVSRLHRLYTPYVLNGLRLFLIFLVMRYFVVGYTGWSFLGGIKYSLLIISGFGSAPLAGALWFLRALFMVSVLFLGIKLLTKNCKGENKKEILTFMVVFGFLVLGYKTQLPYSISASFVALFFYYIGYLYAKNMGRIKINLIFFIMAAIVVMYSSCINTVDLAFNKYTYLSLFILSSICGSYCVLFISEKIKQHKTLEFIGQKSLPIMIFHFLSFVPINLLIVHIYDLQTERILDYPTIKEYNWWWILYAFMGITMPVFIDKIISGIESKIPSYFTFTFWFKKLKN